jgi:hypothetical protein
MIERSLSNCSNEKKYKGSELWSEKERKNEKNLKE